MTPPATFRIPLGDYLGLLRAYLRPQQARVAALAVLLLGGIALELVNPQLLRRFIDSAQAGGEGTRLLAIATLFIGLAGIRQLAGVLATVLGENVGWSATNALRVDLARHVLGLDMAYLNNTPSGVLNERIDGDINTLAAFFSQLAIKVLGNAVLLVGVLVAVAFEDIRVGAGIAAFAFITLAAVVALRHVAMPHWLANRARAAEFAGFVGERLAGIEDIRALGAVKFTQWQLDRMLREWYPFYFRAHMIGFVTWLLTTVLFAIGLSIALWVGSSLFQAGFVSIGTVYLIFTYTELLRRPINEIRQQVDELQRASASIARVRGLFELKPGITDARALPAAVPQHAGIRFDQVTFAYDDSEPVLRDVSFAVPAGTTVGLLGRTGSGKTTCARMLARLYEPDQGQVLIGDRPLHSIALAELRATVGLVTQDVQLFRGSVRDNLTLYGNTHSDAAIERALADSGIWQWIQGLPAGLNTVLEAGGVGVSAGEAQLLAFARLFLRNPQVILLDEASSRLDPATEHLLDNATQQLLRGRTGIIIAHRLATVQRCDSILILEDGRVAEFGRREALTADADSRYARLLRTGLHEVLT